MRNATSVAGPEAAHPERARFYADLVNGLHALAQPLTILRSTMEVLTLPAAGIVDQRRYLEISARQVARTCAMFSSLQDLVETQLIEAQRVQFDLWRLLTPLIEDQRRILGASGVGLVVTRADPQAPIRGDASRTEHALAAVLRLAGSVSGRGDVIELRAVRNEDYLELTFENTHSHGKRMDSSDRLSLAVAEANILSQNGRYAAVEDPFCVSLALPLENLDGTPCEAGLSHMTSQTMN